MLHVIDPARFAEFFRVCVIVINFLISNKLSYSVLVEEVSVELSSYLSLCGNLYKLRECLGQ